MNILDRMLFRTFLRGYFICLSSILGLYIVVDLFTNVDDFAQPGRSALDILRHLATYYGYRTIQYYDRLCEAMALLAAMFTVAWTQRSNELLPMLSAGVSTHRFLRPILFGAILMLGVGVIVQEFVMPRIGGALVTDRDDPEGTREQVVYGCYDPSGVHIEGLKAVRRDSAVRKFTVTLPQSAKSRMSHLTAEYAQYIPPAPDSKPGKDLAGGWMLTGTTPIELAEGNYDPEVIRMIDPGKYFLWVRDATFEAATAGAKTQVYASTEAVSQLLQRTDVGRMNQLAVTFHMRITRPIVGVLLVVMGLSIILRDQTRHMFISAGLCLVMCAVFFAAVFACRFLGNADYIAPALAAWLPVIIFSPFAIAYYDAIHT